jgi:hypothetical protein
MTQIKDKPDIIASIQFISSKAGGRKSPIVMPIFKCIFEHQDEMNDCAIFLDELGDVWPGQRITAPIKFLYPELVRPRIKIGDSFKLREMGTIANGVIEEIIF